MACDCRGAVNGLIQDDLERNSMVVPLLRSLTLAEAARTHELSQTGHVRGKIVLRVGG